MNVKPPSPDTQDRLTQALNVDISDQDRDALVLQVIKNLQKNANGLGHDEAASIADQSFELYVRVAGSGKPKSSRNLLKQLVTFVLSQAESVQDLIFSSFASKIVKGMAASDDLDTCKSVLQSLTVLVSKVPSFVARIAAAATHDQGNTEELGTESILLSVLKFIEYQTTVHLASQAVVAIVRSAVTSSDCETIDWVRPVLEQARRNDEARLSLQHHLFPELFALDHAGYLRFLELCGLRAMLIDDGVPSTSKVDQSAEEDNLPLCLMALQVGKEIGLVDDEEKILRISGSTLTVPVLSIHELLEDNDSAVRLGALMLLLSTRSTTKPVSAIDLKALRRNIPHLCLEMDADIRGEILSCLQRLNDRVRSATSTLARKVATSHTLNALKASRSEHIEAQQSDAHLKLHRAFMTWLLRFAESGLRPSATYQRHFSSLKLLSMVLRSGIDSTVPESHLTKAASGNLKWPFQIKIISLSLVATLLDLLLDPFDDIRALTASILAILLPRSGSDSEELQGQILGDLPVQVTQYSRNLLGLVERAERMMLVSGRADHADGYARGMALCCVVFTLRDISQSRPSTTQALQLHVADRILRTQLGPALQQAKTDQSEGMLKNPLHGRLTSLHYVIELPGFWTKIEEDYQGPDHPRDLGDYLVKVWDCVKDVLCVDAPEGHVPEDLEANADTDTKTLLSYCWRALKEASLLARSFATAAPGDLLNGPTCSAPSNTERPISDVISDLTALLFTQLIELRHRGAFSAVAQAFAACCNRAHKEGKFSLLERLYTDALAAVAAKSTKITRRSAGIPSLFIGILNADSTGPLLARAMQDLEAVARADIPPGATIGDSLPQVHALNTMKAIFVNAKLGAVSEPYLSTALALAAKCLTSSAWPIRNCGIMLFRALVDRLLGTADGDAALHDANQRARVSWSHVPQLLEVVEGIIAQSTTVDAQSPASLEGVFPVLQLLQRIRIPDDRRGFFYAAFPALIGGPNWHVRDMVARTYSRIFRSDELLSALGLIMPSIDMGQNAVHGRLLCIKYLLWTSQSSSYGDAWAYLCTQSKELFEENPCPFTQAAYLDCLTTIAARCIAQNHPFDATLSIDLNRTSETTILKRAKILLEIVLGVLDEVSNKRFTAASDARQPTPTQTHDRDELLCKVIAGVPSRDLAWTLEALVEYIPLTLPIWRSSPALLHTLDATLREPHDPVLIQRIENIRTELATPHDGASETIPTSTIDLLERIVNGGETMPPMEMQSALTSYDPRLSAVPRRDVLVIIGVFLGARQPFPMRMAAITALQNLTQHPATATIAQEEILTLSLVHRVLNDDDDEIRDKGSSIYQTLTPAPPTSSSQSRNRRIVPPIASKRVLGLLGDRYSSRDLVTLAVQNVTEPRFEGTESASVSDLVKQANTNTALFRVERQNLYLDRASFASDWATILCGIHASAIDRAEAENLARWTERRLVNLVEVAEKTHTSTNANERMGAFSELEVFEDGVRTLCAARAILTWRGKHPSKMEGLWGEVLRLVVGLKAKEVCLPGTWVEIIDEVLAETMAQKVGRVMGAIRSVEVATGTLKATWKG